MINAGREIAIVVLRCQGLFDATFQHEFEQGAIYLQPFKIFILNARAIVVSDSEIAIELP